MLEYFLIAVFAAVFIYAVMQIVKGNTGGCGGKACKNCKHYSDCERYKNKK